MDLVTYYNRYWLDKDDSVDYGRLKLIIDHINPGDKILDVDCGPGMLSMKLKEKGAIVKGTDISTVAVERAREKGLDAVQVDLDTEVLPFEDNYFDCVISDSSIEHIFYYEKAIKECARVTRLGGKFILLTPNIGHWRYRLWLLFGRFPYIKNSPSDITHLRFMTIYEVKKICLQYGMTIKKLDGSASLWVKGLYPGFFRAPIIKQIYTKFARKFPSLFARDIILICEKTLS